MVWAIRLIGMLLLAGLLWFLLQPSPTPSAASGSPPHTATTHDSASIHTVNSSAPVRMTVYQQQDASGVTQFSDRADRGQPRVVDHSKGTTYQSTYGGQAASSETTHDPFIDPIERLKQDNARFQQQAQHAKQQRMDAIIDE